MFSVKKQLAFSLLEILIAVAIMSIMVAFAMPKLGGASNKLAKQEILRIVAAIELVRDQSILLNREFGLTIDEKGYQFLELVDEEDESQKGKNKASKNQSNKNSNEYQSTNNNDKNNGERKPKLAKWMAVAEMPELGRHEFPEGLEINLTLDEENLFSTNEDEVNIFEKEIDIFENEEDDKKEFEPPQIYFLSSGEQNQFSIGIAVSDKVVKVDDPQFFRVRGFLTGELKYEGPLDGNLFQDLDRNYEQDEY